MVLHKSPLQQPHTHTNYSAVTYIILPSLEIFTMLQKTMQLFMKHVVGPCLEDGEPYASRSKKILVAVSAMSAMNGVLLGVPITVLLLQQESIFINYLIGVVLIYPAFTASIIPYGYMRCTKTLPNWIVTMQIWALVPIIIVFSLFFHHSTPSILISCMAIVGIVMRAPGWPIILVLTVLACGMHAVINDYPEELPELHSAMYRTHPLPVRIMCLMGVNMGPLFMFGIAVYAIIKEYDTRADQADAAIAMNLAVAEKLRRYDTDGVASILAANKGKVDENLLEAFTAIQHNLQEYRPHIPDYVIAATTDKGSAHIFQDETQSDLPESIDNVHDFRLPSESVASDGDSDGSDTPNGPLGGSGGGGMNGSTTLTTSPSLADDANSTAMNLGSVQGEYSSIRSTMSSMRRAKDFGGDALTAHFYGRATTVFVRFGGPCLDAATDSAADRIAATLTVNTCVEAASKHARAHGGALQYMQGCGLMVSFNAASRVMSHERDACLFAECLRQDITPLRNVYVHISVVTTPVLSFFAGKSGQLMLTVLGNFMPQHTAIHHHGRSLLGATSMSSIVLLASSTMYGLGVSVTARPVGVVCVEDSKMNKISTQLFQVVGLVDQQPNAADDWMFAMERDEEENEGSKQTSAELEAAMKLALADDFSTALDVIRTSTVQDSVVEYITKRLEACMASETEFPVKVDTHRMW